jgi:hypothetical protein
VDDITAATVEQAAEVIESAADVDIANINMPVLVGAQRLLETLAFAGRLAVPFSQQPGLSEHPVNGARTDSHYVTIQHHERQYPVTLKRIFTVKVCYSLLLPILKPEISRYPAIVYVDLAVTGSPAIILAHRDPEPADKPHS